MTVHTSKHGYGFSVNNNNNCIWLTVFGFYKLQQGFNMQVYTI